MKKIFTNLFLAACAFALPAAAETTTPENLDGFFRLTNVGFQEALTVTNPYQFGGTVPSVSNVGSIFKVQTGKMFSFADEMEKLQQLLDAGEITSEQFNQRFMNLMNVDSWKSGFYPLTEFSGQGENFIKLMEKFPDYADSAIEYFLNNDAAGIYENYREVLTLLCVFASDIIAPVNLENVDTFTKWAENYLTRCRQVADFGLYLHPIYQVPEGADDETPAEFTGAYYIEFKTPPYVGSLEKAQLYINNMLTEEGEEANAVKLDVWGSAKQYMLQEMAREYDPESPEYKLAEQILGPTLMNQLYIVGESEDGGISLLQLPDAFNTQGITITADDLARCSWQFEQLTEEAPFAIVPREDISDSEGWHYTGFTSPFPCRMLSNGMEAYYATEVDAETGVPALEKIIGDIPSETPVIVRSKSTAAVDNKVMPLDEESEIINGNVLKGVIFSEENPTRKLATFGASAEGPVFNATPEIIPANSVYYDGELTKIGALYTEDETQIIYDLLGREVKNPGKGIYIVNGKKVVR